MRLIVLRILFLILSYGDSATGFNINVIVTSDAVYDHFDAERGIGGFLSSRMRASLAQRECSCQARYGRQITRRFATDRLMGSRLTTPRFVGSGQGIRLCCIRGEGDCRSDSPCGRRSRRAVAAIQEAIRLSVDEISSLAQTIDDLKTVSTGIAVAVEEQTASTRKIAGSVQVAARNTAQTAREIHSTERFAHQSATHVDEIYQCEERLPSCTRELETKVSAFLLSIRAA